MARRTLTGSTSPTRLFSDRSESDDKYAFESDAAGPPADPVDVRLRLYHRIHGDHRVGAPHPLAPRRVV